MALNFLSAKENNLIHWSLAPVIINFPSEEKSILLIGALCAFNNWDLPWTELFQILTVQSLEQDAI